MGPLRRRREGQGKGGREGGGEVTIKGWQITISLSQLTKDSPRTGGGGREGIPRGREGGHKQAGSHTHTHTHAHTLSH